MNINFVKAVSFQFGSGLCFSIFFLLLLHFVPQSGSSRCDLMSGSNDVSEVKSKFVLAHRAALRSTLSFLDEVSTQGQLPFSGFTCR